MTHSSMKMKFPNCEECGKPATGMLHEVPAVCPIRFDESGEVIFCDDEPEIRGLRWGDSNLCVSGDREYTLICSCGHSWESPEL